MDHDSLFRWAAKICGFLKWATVRKRLRNTDLILLGYLDGDIAPCKSFDLLKITSRTNKKHYNFSRSQRSQQTNFKEPKGLSIWVKPKNSFFFISTSPSQCIICAIKVTTAAQENEYAVRQKDLNECKSWYL